MQQLDYYYSSYFSILFFPRNVNIVKLRERERI